MISRSKLFAPVNLKHRIFTKVSTGNLRDRLLEMAHGNGEVLDTLGQELHIREAAMDCAPFAQLVIDTNGILVHVNQEEKLQQSTQSLERMYEELQSTNEELQSAHEEPETTNKELQSANKELETMNQEL